MKTIVMMYVTVMPVFLAGVANRFFCKSDILAWTYQPIDGGFTMSDGKRILGHDYLDDFLSGYLGIHLRNHSAFAHFFISEKLSQ